MSVFILFGLMPVILAPVFACKPIPATERLLPAYVEVGRNLLQNGCYGGITAAIKDCAKTTNGFIVLDSPSGSGKTQCGIALRELDFTRDNNLAEEVNIGPTRLRVAHLVWPNAVTSQFIYEQIQINQKGDGIDSSRFFENAVSFADRYRRVDFANVKDAQLVNVQRVVWEELLQPLLAGDETASYESFAAWRKYNLNIILVLFIDEVPCDPKQVQDLLILREALRRVQGVVSIFAGTNAKEANVVCLNAGYASSNDVVTVSRPWSLFITRLPNFRVDTSTTIQKRWDQVKTFSESAEQDSDARVAFEAISCSIAHGGNPRMINFAISSFLEETEVHGEDFNFGNWQERFSNKVTKNKFALKTWEAARDPLLSQVNLLSEATSSGALSDRTLASHFAHRIFPEKWSGPFTLNDCGGWLYFADRLNRLFGRSLLFKGGERLFDEISDASHAWQTTVFAPVADDPLLYLGCCRTDGFFSVVDDNLCTIEKLRSHQLLLPFWSENSAGFMNLQNPRSTINTGSLLEVLGSIALCNAAAVSHEQYLTLPLYLINLLAELGISCPSDKFLKLFPDGDRLHAVRVPRFLFPGTDLAPGLTGSVGLVERQGKGSEFDAIIRHVLGPISSLRCEMKDRAALGNRKMVTVIKKLVKEDGSFGIILVRGCNQYWDRRYSGQNMQSLRAKLKRGNVKIGRMDFIGQHGEIATLNMDDSSRSRILLLKVPPSVLGRQVRDSELDQDIDEQDSDDE